MSKFNKYGNRLDIIVREALAELEKAEIAEREATRTLQKYPEKMGIVSPEYAAGQARAKANALETAAALKSVRQNVPDKARKQLCELRREFENALFEGFAARPGAVDMQAITLLQSGILKPNEYVSLVREAVKNGNYTMARMIGQAAHETAKKAASEADPLLYVAVEEGKKDFSGEYLKAFDDLTDIANRCFNNPGIADQWGAFTHDTIEGF